MVEGMYQIEMSIRLRVAEDAQTGFLKRARVLIQEILEESDLDRIPPEVRLLQPIIGSAPFEWELRVRHRTLGSAGDFLDRFDRAYRDSLGKHMRDQAELEAIENGGISLHRVWVWKPSPGDLASRATTVQ